MTVVDDEGFYLKRGARGDNLVFCPGGRAAVTRGRNNRDTQISKSSKVTGKKYGGTRDLRSESQFQNGGRLGSTPVRKTPSGVLYEV